MFTHSSAYPLAGLCALLNNLIEIRRWAFSQQQQSINTTRKQKKRPSKTTTEGEMITLTMSNFNSNNYGNNYETTRLKQQKQRHQWQWQLEQQPQPRGKKTTTYATPTIITTKKAVKRTMDLELKSSYKYKTKQWQKINATFSVTRSSCATSTNARFPRGLTALGPGRLPWRCSCHYCLLFKSKSTV